MVAVVVLILVGAAAAIGQTFLSHRDKSPIIRGLAWICLIAALGVIIFSNVQTYRSDRALQAVQDRVKPRHLTDRAKFIAFLKEYRRGPVEVRCSGSDVEARNFAIEIDNALREAGWDSRLNDNVILFPQPVGLILWIHSVD